MKRVNLNIAIALALSTVIAACGGGGGGSSASSSPRATSTPLKQPSAPTQNSSPNQTNSSATSNQTTTAPKESGVSSSVKEPTGSQSTGSQSTGSQSTGSQSTGSLSTKSTNTSTSTPAPTPSPTPSPTPTEQPTKASTQEPTQEPNQEPNQPSATQKQTPVASTPSQEQNPPQGADGSKASTEQPAEETAHQPTSGQVGSPEPTPTSPAPESSVPENPVPESPAPENPEVQQNNPGSTDAGEKVPATTDAASGTQVPADTNASSDNQTSSSTPQPTVPETQNTSQPDQTSSTTQTPDVSPNPEVTNTPDGPAMGQEATKVDPAAPAQPQTAVQTRQALPTFAAPSLRYASQVASFQTTPFKAPDKSTYADIKLPVFQYGYFIYSDFVPLEGYQSAYPVRYRNTQVADNNAARTLDHQAYLEAQTKAQARKSLVQALAQGRTVFSPAGNLAASPSASAPLQAEPTPAKISPSTQASLGQFKDALFLARTKQELTPTWQLAFRVAEHRAMRELTNYFVTPTAFNGETPISKFSQLRTLNRTYEVPASLNLVYQAPEILSRKEAVGLTENFYGGTLVSTKLSSGGFKASLAELAAASANTKTALDYHADKYFDHWTQNRATGAPAPAGSNYLYDRRYYLEALRGRLDIDRALVVDTGSNYLPYVLSRPSDAIAGAASLSVDLDPSVRELYQDYYTNRRDANTSLEDYLGILPHPPSLTSTQLQQIKALDAAASAQVKRFDQTIAALQASKVHNSLTGKGVQLMVVDSGFFDMPTSLKEHPEVFNRYQGQAVTNPKYTGKYRDPQTDAEKQGGIAVLTPELAQQAFQANNTFLSNHIRNTATFYGNRAYVVPTNPNQKSASHGRGVVAVFGGDLENGGIAPEVDLQLVSSEGYVNTNRSGNIPDFQTSAVQTFGDVLTSLASAPKVPHILNASFGWSWNANVSKINKEVPSEFELARARYAAIETLGHAQNYTGIHNALRGLFTTAKVLQDDAPLVVFATGNNDLPSAVANTVQTYQRLRAKTSLTNAERTQLEKVTRDYNAVQAGNYLALVNKVEAGSFLDLALNSPEASNFTLAVTGVTLDFKPGLHTSPEVTQKQVRFGHGPAVDIATFVKPPHVPAVSGDTDLRELAGIHSRAWLYASIAHVFGDAVSYLPERSSTGGSAIVHGFKQASAPTLSDSRYTQPYSAVTAYACGAVAYNCLAANSTFTQNLYALTTLPIEGTSQAAPEVSAIAALVKQNFPFLTAQGLKTTLLTTATDLGAPGVDEIFGWGLVNAAAALRGPASFAFGDLKADLRRGLNTVDHRKDVQASSYGSEYDPEVLPYALGWSQRYDKFLSDIRLSFDSRTSEFISADAVGTQTEPNLYVPVFDGRGKSVHEPTNVRLQATLAQLRNNFLADLKTTSQKYNTSTNIDPETRDKAYYFTNNINGDGGLHLWGTENNWLYLTGQNTYSGPTVVNSANLVYTSPARFFGDGQATNAAGFADNAQDSARIAQYVRDRLTPSFSGTDVAASFTSVNQVVAKVNSLAESTSVKQELARELVLPYSTANNNLYYAASAVNSDIYVANGALYANDAVLRSVSSAAKVVADNVLVLGDFSLFGDSTLTLALGDDNQAGATKSPSRQKTDQAFVTASEYYCFTTDCGDYGVPAQTWNYDSALAKVRDSSGHMGLLKIYAADNSALRVGGTFLPQGKLVLAPRHGVASLAKGKTYNLIKYGKLWGDGESQSGAVEFSSNLVADNLDATSSSVLLAVTVNHDKVRRQYTASFSQAPTSTVASSLQSAGLAAAGDDFLANNELVGDFLGTVAESVNANTEPSSDQYAAELAASESALSQAQEVHALRKAQAELLGKDLASEAVTLSSASAQASDLDQETNVSLTTAATQVAPVADADELSKQGFTTEREQAYARLASLTTINGFSKALATNLLADNKLVATLTYRSAATVYASAQTALTHNWQAAQAEVFALATAGQALADAKASKGQNTSNLAFGAFAQYKALNNSWQKPDSYVTGTQTGHYVTAGASLRLPVAHQPVLGLALSYVKNSYQENQVGTQSATSTNPTSTNQNQANLTATSLGTAASSAVGLTALSHWNLGALGVGVKAGYSYQDFTVDRSLLSQNDLQGSLSKHVASLGVNLSHNLDFNLANVKLYADVGASYSLRSALSEKVTPAAGASAATLEGFFVVNGKAENQLAAYATLGAQASYALTSSSLLDAGLALTANYQDKQALTYQDGKQTGAVFSLPVVGKVDAGYSFKFAQGLVRLGASYSKAKAWSDWDLDVKFSLSF